MRHLKKNKRLNMKSSFRKAFLRNNVIHLINYGHLKTTVRRAKETKKLAEKVVCIAAKGKDFNAIRRVKQLIPYSKDAVNKLFDKIAPNYVDRPGGYTRIFKLGIRCSDTSDMARLEWV